MYIATPPHVHMAYTLRVAQAGKPVYVEKPMARTYDECQAMIDACRAAGVPLFVAYYRRALPRFLKIKALIDEGAIGTVRSVAIALHQPPAPAELDPANLPWRVVPEIAGGGKFVDLASHMLDFLDYVLGPIRQAQGFASNQAGLYAAEDIVSAVSCSTQARRVWAQVLQQRASPRPDRDRRHRGTDRLLVFRHIPDRHHGWRPDRHIPNRQPTSRAGTADPDGGRCSEQVGGVSSTVKRRAHQLGDGPDAGGYRARGVRATLLRRRPFG